MIEVFRYLDEKNYPLWNYLNGCLDIKIDYSYNHTYGARCKGKNCTIHVPRDKSYDSASFAHELLHVYLYTKNIHIGAVLKLSFNELSPFDIIFDENLCDHISNVLEHLKILPLYLHMGYERNTFISDYNEIKSTIIPTIKNNDIYYSMRVNQFIGDLVAILCDPNPIHNYELYFKRSQNIDKDLFDIIFDFVNTWKLYDIKEEDNYLGPNHYTIVTEFIDKLLKWSENKIFI